MRRRFDNELPPLTAEAELVIFRVAQEALTNVIKHAGSPTQVDVTVQHRPGALAVEVRDDGRGLSARPPHGDGNDGSGHGLVGMRERVAAFGGTLTARTHPDGGFLVVARFPTPSPAPSGRTP